MTFTTHTTTAEANALFVRYQHGDTDALGELYNQWHTYIIKRIRDTHAFFSESDIEDAASEVWIYVQEDALKWDIDRSSWFKFLDYMIGKVVAETCRKRNTHKRRADHGAYRVKNKYGDTDISLLEIMSNAVSVDGDMYQKEKIAYMEHCRDTEPATLDRLIYSERVEVLKAAISVCQFSRQTQQILKLRLQGLTDVEIQTRLGMKSRSQVRAVLSRAIKQLRATIHPETLEIQPPPLTNRSKQEQLAALGIQLSELSRKKGYRPLHLAKALDLQTDVLLAFFKGERKPHAPVLQRMAELLGETVYAIYVPPLTNYPYATQGRQLWYARVRQGFTIQALARLIYLRSIASIRTYEHGESRPSEDRLVRMAETLAAPQLLEIY